MTVRTSPNSNNFETQNLLRHLRRHVAVDRPGAQRVCGAADERGAPERCEAPLPARALALGVGGPPGRPATPQTPRKLRNPREAFALEGKAAVAFRSGRMSGHPGSSSVRHEVTRDAGRLYVSSDRFPLARTESSKTNPVLTPFDTHRVRRNLLDFFSRAHIIGRFSTATAVRTRVVG